jgi:sugar lactone lactonase YvrE
MTKTTHALLLAASLFASTSMARSAKAVPPGTIANFTANLAGTVCANPEGIAADPAGNLYGASDSDGVTVGTICVFNPSGGLSGTISVPAGSGGIVTLLGLAFHGSHTLFACDAGNPDDGTGSGRLLRIDTSTGVVTSLGSGFVFPNAVALDPRGNVYVSDSVAGTITRMRQDGSNRVVWSSDPLLSTTGFPPFGANGVAFDLLGLNLYVANTGDSRVLRIPVLPNGNAGAVQIFADGATINTRQHTTEALHGADGVALDLLGNVYVAANQANEIQVLSPLGTLIARFGSTASVTLDFPASFVFKGAQLYFTNASLFDGGAESRLLYLQGLIPGIPLN